MAKRAGIGIIGAGNISRAYLDLAPLFAGVELVAIADKVKAAAQARAGQYSIHAMSVDALLKNDEVEAVINLTVPDAHFAVSQAILSAGKHCYSEKPLALGYKQAKKLADDADRRGLKIGGAPDTFLGGGGQAARRLIDKGTVGKIVGGSARILSHGMEHWHPNPAFFFKPGAGPVFDVGPYHITTLVSLLGPVKWVVAMAMKGVDQRIVTSEPLRGSRIKVTTPTTIDAVLEFHSGAQVTLAASWDVWAHGRANPIELYGTKGTMFVPDPNFFGGVISCSDDKGQFTDTDTGNEAFAAANWPAESLRHANYRMLGVADLIDAVRHDREPRCSGRLAAHVVEVMESILTSAAKREFVKIRSMVERPAPLKASEAKRLMARR
jgi:predicted dehydrogenase